MLPSFIDVVVLLFQTAILTNARAAKHAAVSHVDASTFLFPPAAGTMRRSLLRSDDEEDERMSLTYETLSVVDNPITGQLQKKVQQMHHGLPVFGHSFVIGENLPHTYLDSRMSLLDWTDGSMPLNRARRCSHLSLRTMQPGSLYYLPIIIYIYRTLLCLHPIHP